MEGDGVKVPVSVELAVLLAVALVLSRGSSANLNVCSGECGTDSTNAFALLKDHVSLEVSGAGSGCDFLAKDCVGNAIPIAREVIVVELQLLRSVVIMGKTELGSSGRHDEFGEIKL